MCSGFKNSMALYRAYSTRSVSFLLVSLKSAEEYAQNVLGLIKMDSAQIEYVNLEKENKIVSEEAEVSDRSAIAFLSTVIGWFNP